MDMFKFVRWGEDVDREFEGTSDRAAAVVGASLLDAHLRVLFEAVLSHDADLEALLEGTNAPLQSLSAKSDMAFALGLISRREHRNLVIIRRIRNIFAHRVGQVSFSVSEISDRCAELDVPLAMRLPDEIPVKVLSEETTDAVTVQPVPFTEPRQRFQIAVDYTSKCLGIRFMEAVGVKHESKTDFERPSQLLEARLARVECMRGAIAKQEERLERLSGRCEERRETIDSSPGTTEHTLSGQAEIRELESNLRSLKESPAQRMLDLLDPLQESLLSWVRRWEAWVEQEKPGQHE